MRFHSLFYLFFFISFYASAQNVAFVPNVIDTNVIAYGRSGGPVTASEDFFGYSCANIGDLDNDGVTDLVVGSLKDDNGAASSTDYGAVHILFMNANKTVKSYSKIGKGTQGIGSDISSVDYFGGSVAGLGDFNGDGVEDIVVGSHLEDVSNYTNSGAIYVIFLTTQGGVSSYKKITRGTNGGPTSIGAQSYFGRSVCNLGDINGDGITDIGVGGSNHNGSGSGSANGAFWVLFMNANGTVASSTICTNNVGWNNTLDNNDFFGTACTSPGDLNGDGINDVLVTANGDDDYYANSGCFYLLYLNSSGNIISFKKYTQPYLNNVAFYYNATSFGLDILAEDVNGDGKLEFIGSNINTNGIFIFCLDDDENIINVKEYASNKHCPFGFSVTGIGISLASLGDIDSDGSIELISGAHIFDSQGLTNNGGLFVFDLEEVVQNYEIGDVFDYDKIAEYSNNFPTIDASDFVGLSGANLGDVNGDGYNDIAIGAYGDDDGGSAAGSVYIAFLDSTMKVSSYQKISATSGNFGTGLDAGDQFGVAIAAAGDLDGDNVPDLFVGANGDDDGGSNCGAVWVVFLNSNGTVKRKQKISNTRGGLGSVIVSGGHFGLSVASIGDIDNDGISDVAIGTPNDNDGGTGRGAFWVLFLNAADSVKGKQKISDLQGDFNDTFSGNSTGFGVSLSAAGDFNGDGNEDVLVGSSSMDGTGSVHLLYLGTDGKVDGYKKINNQNGNFPVTLQSGRFFGRGLCMINDINGDGHRDVLIGQRDFKNQKVNKGAVWLAMLDSAANVIDYKLYADSSSSFYGTIASADFFGVGIFKYLANNSKEHYFIGASQMEENSTAEGGLYRISLIDHATISSVVTSNNSLFYDLNKSLDGGYYVPVGNYLRFKYFEEYRNGTMKYSIYRANQTHLYDQTVLPLSLYNETSASNQKVFGQNYMRLNIGYGGLCLPAGDYIFETINDKNEKMYLRFKKTVSSPCFGVH